MIFDNWGNKKTQKQTFEKLYHQYARVFKGVCLRYTQSSAEADDILQEAYIKIHKNLHLLKDINAFESWGKRIIINTALKQIKDNKKNKHVDIDNLEYEISEEDEQVSLSYMDDLDISELIEMMKKLPEGYNTIMNLYAVEGYSHKEIGEMLQIKEASSRSQYFRAKKAFQLIILETATENRYDKFAV